MGRNGQMEGSISIGPVQPRNVVHLERWASFFRNFPGWIEPIHSLIDRNSRKFWLNGSRPFYKHCSEIWGGHQLQQLWQMNESLLRITKKALIKGVLISTSIVKIVKNHQERPLLKQINLTKVF